MKAIKITVLTVLFILSIGLFSTSKVYAENPPNTYSIITYENGIKIETVYNVVDGGVVQVRIVVND
jgi:hypothetical protein